MMKKIDMGWGNPEFLSPYWADVSLKAKSGDLPILYTHTATESLKDSILRLHDRVGNAATEGRRVVVGAGASQVLIAALRAIAKRKGTNKAWAEPPHFLRFPIFAELAGLKWQNDPSSITIATSPNNPDGKTLQTTDADILNGSYMWPQYAGKVQKLDHPLFVASLSKATGHAGTRIGWALVKDPEIAKEMEEYIELSTCGTSIEAQTKAEAVIEHELRRKKQGVFEYGALEMRYRWARIDFVQKICKPPFEVLNNSGMFLWAKGVCPEEITSVSGDKMGKSGEFFRLNVGCSREKFEDFLDVLRLKYSDRAFGSSADV